MRRALWAGGLGLGLATAMLGACAGMGDNSNPTLSIESARVQGDSAILRVLVFNPGDHDLTLTGINYELVFGPLPVASGTYAGLHALPADASASFDLRISFDQPAMDPGASDLSLTGSMSFEDSGARGNMRMTSASFDADASVR